MTTIGQLSGAFIQSGYKNGDVVTIIVASANDDETAYIPKTIQFQLDSTSDALITTLSDGGMRILVGNNGTINVVDDVNGIKAGAVIVARFENDKWRRSTQTLVVDEAVMTAIGAASYKAAAIASYSNTVGEPNPMVYLDGDELNNA